VAEEAEEEADSVEDADATEISSAEADAEEEPAIQNAAEKSVRFSQISKRTESRSPVFRVPDGSGNDQFKEYEKTARYLTGCLFYMPERAGQKAEFSGILAELPEWGAGLFFC
jgi:hypothetical protein